MALITIEKLSKLEKDRYIVHKEVEATYTIFNIDEKRYLQIDTYGSEDRLIKGKVSQSIQMSEDTIIKIIEKLGL